MENKTAKPQKAASDILKSKTIVPNKIAVQLAGKYSYSGLIFYQIFQVTFELKQLTIMV